MAPKTLLVFCDGTGMDGSLAPPTSSVAEGVEDVVAQQLEGGGGGNKQYATNVLRLARSVLPTDTKGNRQIVFYQSGVGSEADFAGDPVTGTTALQALGTAVASKIRDAYAFIAQNFEDGDEICLFGFSRGAYTARKVSGLIDDIGLLTRQNLGHFFEIWRQLTNKETPTIPPGTRQPSIKIVGVFDTVGSVYKEIDALNINDASLPKTVKNAFHAVSLQENRKKFLPTLWTIPQGGLQPGQVLKQLWFPGAHSDVGGGYERHELADISVFWMAGEVKNLINLDTDFLRSWSQARPDAWGTSQPHNAYMETAFIVRHIVGHETRLESNDITTQSLFHESIRASPQTLVPPNYMVTLTIIKQKFGGSWVPKYSALNEFEQYCKDHWGTQLGALPPSNDDPGAVIRPVSWIPGQSGQLPSNAIVGGQERPNRTIYIARAPYAGGIHPGKIDSGRVYISYAGKEILISGSFDVLVGAKVRVRWVRVTGGFSFEALGGAIPVVGGRDADFDVFYIAQIIIASDIIHCGKVKIGGNALVPYQGTEHTSNTYNVLCFA